nr:farnesyl diphosphate synthase [Pardosa pseudoannulata]
MSFSCLTGLKKITTIVNLTREYFLIPNHHWFAYSSLKQKQQRSLNTLYMSCKTYSRNIGNHTEKKVSVCDTDLDEFNNAYELIRKAVLHTNDKALVDAVNWGAKVLDYNVQDGKKNRGVTVLKSFKILAEDKVSPDAVVQACILGWCVEMLQGFFLVCDDIMDHSTIRRGKPCWYKLPNVGLIAINDGLLLESGIYKVLEIYFKNSEAYINLLHEFLQVTQKTVYGQALDMLNSPPNMRPRFENFNLEKYRAVVEYKTSHYTFCLPVHLAMHLIGNFSKEDFDITRNICLKLGLLFQIQDDYIDVFGDPSVTGKVGSDIIEGKCNWFAASLFEEAPESVKATMIENYGVNNDDSISKVMKLFKDLHLEDKYYECEKTLMNELTNMIDSLSGKPLQELFYALLKKLHKRKK